MQNFKTSSQENKYQFSYDSQLNPNSDPKKHEYNPRDDNQSDGYHSRLQGENNNEEICIGMELLREYVFNNKFDFLRQCSMEDGFDKGILKPHTFKFILRNSTFNFKEKHVQDIFQNAPKTENEDVKYKMLMLKIKKMGPPNTFYSLTEFLERTDGSVLENIDLILSDDFFAKKFRADLKSFGLEGLNMDRLWKDVTIPREDKDLATIIDYNNNLILSNFNGLVSKQILKDIRNALGIPNDIDLEDDAILQGLGVKKFEKYQTIKP